MGTYTPKQFEAKLRRFAKDNPKAVAKGLRKGLDIVRREAVMNHLSGPKMPQGVGSKTNATLARQSGDLATKLNTNVTVGTSGIKARIGSPLKYAPVHEYGATITPKNAKMLVFEIGGQKVFAKKVTIPARPFLHPSVDAKRQEVTETILRHLMREYKASG
jgi:phage gpG-like protein